LTKAERDPYFERDFGTVVLPVKQAVQQSLI
jgi:hypothetical protein